MRCLPLPVLLACAGLVASALVAAEPAGKKPETSSKVTYHCRHAATAPTIDGRPGEDAWKAAEVMKDFGVVRTDNKRAARATTARLLWDEKFLYAAFECVNDGIRTKAVERDDPVWEAEAAELFLCPRGAAAVYYEFNFSPKSVVYDSRVESWKYEEQVKNWKKWAKGF